jgi:small conductance mechanosensitive channel
MIRIKKRRFDSVNFKRQPKVLQTPQPEVLLKHLLLKWQCAPWATSEDYGAVFTETLENCKTAFDAAGIVIQPCKRNVLNW